MAALAGSAAAACHMTWHGSVAYPDAAQYRACHRRPEAPVTAPIGSRLEPIAPARLVYVGGPRHGREEVLELPGGVPTILAVDEPVGYYVRDVLLPDGRWRMAWRGFGAREG
jgi:hypothetical protein